LGVGGLLHEYYLEPSNV